jgi:hypothetical protein
MQELKEKLKRVLREQQRITRKKNELTAQKVQ